MPRGYIAVQKEGDKDPGAVLYKGLNTEGECSALAQYYDATVTFACNPNVFPCMYVPVEPEWQWYCISPGFQQCWCSFCIIQPQ